ncbi:iron-hydroxamate ABC transporter substrate-binding protein [Oceanobacillus bengalensis]|uniref:Iron-hydroxamate ABC transporter substrate-binding protein n=1 Tax=Oceanobacillus bengalensis TaxID=1435466 RepID=A0A494YXH8_9BACI|nr:iron-hydroxamate ABC transporter substrate-binding protein [Oceanobacillus bengalensis]RKQ14403.1 iron-hydroxamate ABC transporter substrate-binding protein [Oceanobacillus bengalensis]
MNTYFSNRNLFLTAIISILVLLAACGDNNTPSEQESETESTEEPSEIVIDSAMGEVTIPAGAKKILAPFHEDALLALGVTPVAKWAIGEMLQYHLESELEELPKIEWNMPLEQVLSYEPDLIILENSMDSYEGTYDDYNKIAPTYVMTEETTGDWRKQIEVFSKLLGKEEAAEKALNDYEEKVASASEEIKNVIGDETVAAMWVTGDQFFLFEKNRHTADMFYGELGINYPKLVEELGDAEVQWNPISIEKLSELDADHVFLLAEEGEQGIETLENSSVWQSTSAVENGNVYILNDTSSWTNTGLIASELTIDAMLNTLVK